MSETTWRSLNDDPPDTINAPVVVLRGKESGMNTFYVQGQCRGKFRFILKTMVAQSMIETHVALGFTEYMVVPE